MSLGNHRLASGGQREVKGRVSVVVENERVGLLGVGDLVVTPSAGAKSAVLIAERAQVPTARSAWLEGALLTPNERNDSEGWYQRALRADRVTQGISIQRLAFESLSPHEREEMYAFTRHTLERTDGRVRPFALAVDQYNVGTACVVRPGQRRTSAW
jgi:hypothetical protein